MSGDFGTVGRQIEELANVVPRMYNAGVTYRSADGKLLVSLIRNFQEEKNRVNLPVASSGDQRRDHQMDYEFLNLEVSYRVTDRVRLTATGRNLEETRPTFAMSDDDIVRNKQQDTGVAWTFAAKIDL